MSVSDKWYEEKQRRVMVVGYTSMGWKGRSEMNVVFTTAETRGEKVAIHVDIW